MWSDSEIGALLGPDAASFAAAYDVTPTATGRVKPSSAASPRRATKPRKPPSPTIARACSPPAPPAPRPGRDDKILADWNGLMIAALARAAAIFREPAWLALASSAYRNLRALLTTPDDRLHHAWRDGTITAAGLLDDHAAIARAALALFEATGDQIYLTDAQNLAASALVWFADTDGSFYTTASDAPDVPAIRPRTAADNATPNANGLMAEVFARLHHLTGDPAWRTRATAIITSFSGAADKIARAVHTARRRRPAGKRHNHRRRRRPRDTRSPGPSRRRPGIARPSNDRAPRAAGHAVARATPGFRQIAAGPRGSRGVPVPRRRVRHACVECGIVDCSRPGLCPGPVTPEACFARRGPIPTALKF
ncbi:MAG: hypothetical protein WDN04_27325 [Rhodospirillales bacterium]